LHNLQSLGYTQMTPVQARSLPLILQGRDVIAQAKTGSGKTAAFGLGLIDKIKPRYFAVQALVLCPTRELAEQVARELRRLAQAIPNIKLVTLCGGKPFGPQKGSLQHGAHIVVGTPGRILDHLTKRTLRLDGLNTLVLDEADRMLDMGFAEAMQQIVKFAPRQRQTLLFSATYPDAIQQLSRHLQQHPLSVSVESQHQPGVIEQVFYEVQKHQRNNTLLALFEHYHPTSAIVFCHTKKQCDAVAAWLNEQQSSSRALQGEREQRQRDRVMLQFANHSCPVLVATDVAARGLDVKSLQAVINYELPRDAQVYVHRIGRTGRAGEQGLALSIFTAAEQVRVSNIAAMTQQPAICDVYDSLDRQAGFKLYAPVTTLEINVGRKDKIRPGDLLGALTGDAGLAAASIGKIDIFDQASFVAIDNSAFNQALDYMDHGKVKGRRVRARAIAA